MENDPSGGNNTLHARIRTRYKDEIRMRQLVEELCIDRLNDALEIAHQTCPDASESVPIIRSVVQQCLADYPFREKIILDRHAKRNETAAELRKQANAKVPPPTMRWYAALKQYNEALTYTEADSDQRSLLYANRSVICLQMQRYEECLENVRLAREFKYPAELMDKLNRRETDARQALAKNAQQKKKKKAPPKLDREPRLSYPGHANAPHVANCLHLRRNELYGRHVITYQPLNVGDFVMFDRPYVKTLHEELRLVRCDHCHGERPFTLIPCEGCTWVMYCSEECLRTAHDQYHRYECKIIRSLWWLGGRFPVTALRTVAQAIAAFDHDLAALADHLDVLEGAPVNGFTLDWTTASPKQIFDTVHLLVTNQERRNYGERTCFIVMASILQTLLLEKTELGAMCENSGRSKEVLFKLLFHFLQSISCNHQVLSFNEFDPDPGRHRSKEYGTACYPLVSMLNHSCANNVKRLILRDGRCAIVVIRPIMKGDQLFDNYGLHHTTHPLAQRVRAIPILFNFSCSCEACLRDYPTLDTLTNRARSELSLPRMLQLNAMENALFTYDRDTALAIMEELQPKLNRNSEYLSGESWIWQLSYERSHFVAHQYTSENYQYWKYCKP